MVLGKYVKAVIDAAEDGYRECWGYLSSIKTFNSTDGDIEVILKFQPRLAEILFSLSSCYRKLHQEKQRLISKKREVSVNWYRSRMKGIARHQEIVNRTISIGKALGDAYAWFFYQRDAHYLQEHLKLPENPHIPPGIGGRGEIEVIKRLKKLSKYLIIYHGTTNILRLGDVSLIDVSTFRVAGIAEIKSRESKPGVIEVTMLMSGPDLNFSETQARTPTQIRATHKETLPGWPQSAKERLKRQIKRIEASFKHLKSQPEQKISFSNNSLHSELEILYRSTKTGTFTYRKAGEGLLLVAHKPAGTKRSLYSKLSNNHDAKYNDKLSGIESRVLGLLDKTRKDNSIFVRTLFYDRDGKARYLLGMTHFFWWPVDLKLIERILFQDIVLVTIYNPAHLMRKFEDNGYQTEITAKGDYMVYKKNEEKRITLEGIPFFIEMIQRYLFPEESVVKILKDVEEKLSNIEKGKSIRIDLMVMQQL